MFAQKVGFVVVCHNARTKHMLLYISFQKIKVLYKKEMNLRLSPLMIVIGRCEMDM